MADSLGATEFFWKLDNFCFCDFYSNDILHSPEFTVRAHVTSRWLLYMFPNGQGDRKYIGIYLKRLKEDDGPEEIGVRFKISLMDADGCLCPDADWKENVFPKDREWGHNEFIKRSDIVPGSVFLHQDALTIVCQLCLVKENRPQRITCRQISSQLGEEDEINSVCKSSALLNEDKLYSEISQSGEEDEISNVNKALALLNEDKFYNAGSKSGKEDEINNVCKALAFLNEDKLYSDMILQGNNRNFNVHRCILSARLPGMYNIVRSDPHNIFKDDFITEKFLSYAYTGKLDMKDFCDFSLVKLKETLQEYGLLHLEKNLFSNSTKYAATTYFYVESLTHSWNIPTSLLDKDENIYSKFISDASQKTVFLIRLIKMGTMWKIEIKPSSSTNDDVYVRCFISIKNAFKRKIASDISEYLCKSNTWWQYPTSLLLHNGSLIINGQYLTLDCDFFDLDFMFMYPSGEYESRLNNEVSRYASNTERVIKDTQQLMEDLENLYYNQNDADATIVVGSKEFKVHKCLLCARSPYFRAAFQHKFDEKSKNQVNLKNEYLDEQTFQEVIDKLLLFVYCGKFEAHSPTIANLLHVCIDMYRIGEYHY